MSPPEGQGTITDRGALPEHAERLARYMARDHGRRLADVDRDLGLPQVVAAKVGAIRDAMSARFMQTLKTLMRKRPELLAFDPAEPRIVRFDAEAAGAADEIIGLMPETPRLWPTSRPQP